MTLTARLSRTALRWRSGIAARRALSCAVYGDDEQAHRITAAGIERGPSAVRALAGAWCAALLDGVPRSERRSGVYWPRMAMTVPEVPTGDAVAAALWVMSLTAAHTRRDWDACRVLVDTLRPAEIETHLAVLLHMAAHTVAARAEEAAL